MEVSRHVLDAYPSVSSTEADSLGWPVICAVVPGGSAPGVVLAE